MIWLLVLILFVLVVGFLSLHWRISTMRDEMNQEFESLADELAGINTVAESAVALIEHQGEQLKAIVAGSNDADEIKARITALVDAGEAVKAKLANAIAANTAATSEDHPVEQPLPEPTVDTGAGASGDAGTGTGGDPTGGDSGGDTSGAAGGDTSGTGDAGSGVDTVQDPVDPAA